MSEEEVMPIRKRRAAPQIDESDEEPKPTKKRTRSAIESDDSDEEPLPKRRRTTAAAKTGISANVSAMKIDSPAPKSPAPKTRSKIATTKEATSSAMSIGESELLDAVNDVDASLLDGMTIVLSGVMVQLAREKLDAWIVQHGGKCTGSISGKTDILIVGSKLEDGREVNQGGKFKKAMEKGTSIMTEFEFEKFIQEKSGNTDFQLSMRDRGLLDAIAEASPLKEVEVNKGDNQMWTERYKPRSVYDLVGNQAVVDQLYEWLKDWDEVCLRGNKKQIPFRRGMSWQDQPNINARAALLSGPPGIGKTSAARIVCAQLGYEVVEQNASDTRNKSAIESGIKDLSSNKTLTYFSVAGRKKEAENTNPLAAAIGGLATQKSVIIMDEVDGLGAGDRGGVAALIKIIKEAKTPIICICNDRQD